MSSWVRIKKSKVLRNKFIAMMYLLFIALSVINIPIEWLRVNRYLSPALLNSVRVDFVNEELDAIHAKVLAVNDDFVSNLRLNDETGEYAEPFGYVTTDDFFLKQGRGREIQSALMDLPAAVKSLGEEKEALFQHLFQDDLQNGLLEDSDQWVNWKFKHAPSSLVEVLVNEITLRLRLLGGDLSASALSTSANKSNPSWFKGAMNIDYLALGDTLKLYAESDLNEVFVEHENNRLELNRVEEAYLFMPEAIGLHRLVINDGVAIEEYEVRVLPSQLRSEKNEGFITYFEQMPATLEVQSLVSSGIFSCSCDSTARFSEGVLRFTPSSAGWCTIKVQGANGALAIHDSILVHPSPQPEFKLSGLLPGGALPKGEQRLRMEAFHPIFDLDYDVVSFTYAYLDNEDGDHVVNGPEVKLDKAGTLWIKDVVAASGSNRFASDRDFIVTIDP